jgi:transposase
VRRGDLTDDEWAVVEPHLPLGACGPIPDLRNQFNAVMWRFRTGSPWRDVPERYGHWSTIYDRFRIWAHDGGLPEPDGGDVMRPAFSGQLLIG